MVSKLIFKGDNNRKRKRHRSSEDKSKRLKHDDDAVGTAAQAEGWINASNHLNGPIVIAVLGDSAPVCMCADSEGKVFTSTDLDLYGDSDSVMECIEPSSVQQVFVLGALNFVDGKQKLDTQSPALQFSLKTSHGRFLSAHKSGVLEARATSVGPNEMFTFEQVSNSWTIKTIWNQFVSIVPCESSKTGYEARADSKAPFTVTVRMQAKFVPSIPKAKKDYEYLSTRQLEERAGRRLTSDQVRELKAANKNGNLNEVLLDLRLKSKSDTRC